MFSNFLPLKIQVRMIPTIFLFNFLFEVIAAEGSDDDGNYERLVGTTTTATTTAGDVVDFNQELYDDGYEQLHPKDEEALAAATAAPHKPVPRPPPASDLYAVVDTKAKVHQTSSNSSQKQQHHRPGTDERVMCRLVDLPPVERARKVVQIARGGHHGAESATNMTVVTINDDEISIRNHLKEELPTATTTTSVVGHYARTTSNNGPVHLVVHSSGIFEDVTMQL